MNGVLIVLLLLTLALLWLTQFSRIKHKTRADALAEELAETEKTATDFVVAVTPLIEKSDWMTGRWGGMFEHLVRMEKDRNAHVVRARKALFNIPFVHQDAVQVMAHDGEIRIGTNGEAL